MMVILLAMVGGLTIGSFLNVVVYRLPRGESLAVPGSHCPSCGNPVRAFDNVPVLSWVVLRGRCRNCHEPISARYPLVEFTSAALAVAVVLIKNTWPERILGLALVAILIPVALIDFDKRVIPNKITIPAAFLAVVLGALLNPSGLPEQLIAGAAAGGFLLVFAIVYPQGMGMGDVKLAAVMGLYLGRSVAVAIIVGTLVGTIFGAVVMARVGVKDGRKTAVPFGPFLALGGIVAVLFGPQIVHWYLHTMG
jgi:leader peptidase (prepilin peptidase) / N-methyltransferase